MIRTARNIESSLEVARRQRAFCRTFSIEQGIRERLQHEFGPILSDEEKGRIVARESRSLKARDDAIKKARMNLLKQKERGLLAMSVRNGSASTGRRDEEEKEEGADLAKIVVDY